MGFDPFRKYGGVGELTKFSDGYLVVLQHPVTTEYEISRKHVTETLYAVHELGMPALWFWPNVDAGSDGTSKGLRWFREEINPLNIRFFKNMEPNDFLHLLLASKCIVGNSSVAIRECSFLGVPAVNIGSRQKNRERGFNVIDTGYERSNILHAIRQHLSKGHCDRCSVYGDGAAGKRIADILSTAKLSIEKQLNY